MSAVWRWTYWSHRWSLKCMPDHNFFNPTSLCSSDCKLETWGAWNRCTGPCIDLWDYHFVLNSDATETPGISYVRDPLPLLPYPKGTRNSAPQTNSEPWWNSLEAVGISHIPWFESVKLLGLFNMNNTWHKRKKPYYKCINVRLCRMVNVVMLIHYDMLICFMLCFMCWACASAHHDIIW